MNFEDQCFDVYELYTPAHPNWNLRKTRIHLHSGSNPRDTTEGLQDVTYSPGEHPLLPPCAIYVGQELDGMEEIHIFFYIQGLDF